MDTNRVIAALIRDSTSRRIIMSGKLELIIPRFSLKETLRHKTEIRLKARITSDEFDTLLSILQTKIYIAEEFVFREKRKEAQTIMGRIHANDEPFIALALAIKNDGIWSDDGHFMKQDAVKVYTTSDLLDYV